MSTLANPALGKLYYLNNNVTPNDLHEAINACLSKAQSLAAVMATVDTDEYKTKLINNYLWALSDIVYEIKFLYQQLTKNLILK